MAFATPDAVEQAVGSEVLRLYRACTLLTCLRYAADYGTITRAPQDREVQRRRESNTLAMSVVPPRIRPRQLHARGRWFKLAMKVMAAKDA